MNPVQLRPPAALLFDLDGTLIDSAPDFYGVVNSLRAEDGRPALPHETIREQVSNGGLALGCLTFEVTPEHPDAPIMRQRLLDRYMEMIGSASQLFPYFDQLLDACEQKGIPWGIITNKPRVFTEVLLKRLNIHCPVVVCPDDVSQSKPSPEGLFLAAKALKVNAKDCWYVGDHIRDIEAAKQAEMLSIAALFGYIEADDNPKDWHADIYIEQPQDLLTLVQQQTQKQVQ